MRISDWSSDVCSSDLSHYVPHMGMAPTPFDPDAPDGGRRALIRRNPEDENEVEMVEAVWGSDPRFSDGINYRFVRSEGRAFIKRRCLIPASEFRMGTGDHRYRVKIGRAHV